MWKKWKIHSDLGHKNTDLLWLFPTKGSVWALMEVTMKRMGLSEVKYFLYIAWKFFFTNHPTVNIVLWILSHPIIISFIPSFQRHFQYDYAHSKAYLFFFPGYKTSRVKNETYCFNKLGEELPFPQLFRGYVLIRK